MRLRESAAWSALVRRPGHSQVYAQSHPTGLSGMEIDVGITWEKGQSITEVSQPVDMLDYSDSHWAVFIGKKGHAATTMTKIFLTACSVLSITTMQWCGTCGDVVPALTSGLYWKHW